MKLNAFKMLNEILKIIRNIVLIIQDVINFYTS